MARLRILGYLANSLGQLLAPKVCRICGQSLIADEKVLCLHCLMEVPRTNVHHSDFNDIHRRLGHHVMVDRAAGWFEYKRSTPYAQLLIDSKYGDLPDIDRHLGRACAKELAADQFFEGIEAIVPMPMHWYKKLRRGYNQAEEICRGITEATSIPVVKALTAVKPHGVQSRHNRNQRYASIAHTMVVKHPGEIRGKNILLVDDIITSGASCIEALRAISLAAPAKINVLCLGLTSTN